MRRPQANRSNLLRAIHATPGLHLAELARRTDFSYGGASHHLRELERAGIVTSAMIERRRLYFVPEASATIRQFRVLAPAAAARVARAILEESSATIRDLAMRTGLSRRVVYHHAARLRAAGLVLASGEPMRLAPAEELAGILGAR